MSKSASSQFYDAYSKMDSKALVKARWRMRRDIRKYPRDAKQNRDYAWRCALITEVVDDRHRRKKSDDEMRRVSTKKIHESREDARSGKSGLLK